jgi:hypothetical protein
MYNFHRRNESSKPWRNRYTPKWKSLYKDLALRLGSRRGTIYSNATSQLDRPRATVSRSSAIMAPSSNLEANYLSSNFYTNFEANISPSRAGAPMHADALDAQMNYTREHHNSGGGRTEETRDRVNQQQIDRSRISNRTRARGTEIAAGTTSADGWATIPAKRQVATMKRRVGQNGGPLPSEAITSFDEPIVYFVHEPARQRATTVADVLRRTGQRRERGFKNRRTLRAFFATKRRLLWTCVTTSDVFCNKVYVIRKFWNNFLDKENQDGAKNSVLQSWGISTRSKGTGQIDGRATFGWIRVAPDRRRGQAKHQPTTVLRPRGTSLVEGLEKRRRASMASGVGRDVGRCREGLRLGRAVRGEDEVKPAPALGLRATRLGAGEAQVEAEGDEVTLPAKEPRTATTL